MLCLASILLRRPYVAWVYGMYAVEVGLSLVLAVRVAGSSYFPPVKDAVGLRTSGVYSIPCECGRVYIGQSGQSIQLRIKEHDRHIRLEQPDKSALLNYY